MSVKLRKRKRDHGKTYVYLDLYTHGSRKTELLAILTGDKFHDKETMKMCNEIRAKRDHEITANSHGVIGTYRKNQSFLTYCNELAQQRTSPNTRLSWQNAIMHLENFSGKVVFADLNRQFFENFKSYLLNKVKLSPNSAQVYLARIKTSLHQAVDDNLLPNDPSSKVTIRGKSKLPIHLSLDEVQQLSDTPCANDQVKAAFLFSCFTGLRYSDVDALTWDKIKNNFIEFSQQKTDEAERLPLSDEARRILKQQENAKASPKLRRSFPKNIVFFMPTQPVVDKQLKAWAKTADVRKKISFHKSRHTFATLSLSAGVDLYTTSKLLGHKNLQTTQIYAKVIDEKKTQAVAMLPNLKR